MSTAPDDAVWATIKRLGLLGQSVRVFFTRFGGQVLFSDRDGIVTINIRVDGLNDIRATGATLEDAERAMLDSFSKMAASFGNAAAKAKKRLPP